MDNYAAFNMTWNSWKNFQAIFSSKIVLAEILQQERATWSILTAK